MTTTPAAKPLGQCTLERAPTQAKSPQNVGEHLTLTCQGEFGEALQKNAQVKAPEGAEYSLLVLNVLETSPNQFKAVVTSYRAGQHQNESFEITDGRVSFLTSPQSFNVESVLDPNDKQPKMFGSYGPLAISYPLWFWLSLAAILAAVVGIFGLVWLAQRRRKRLQAELDEYMTMLTPFNQFSKDARINVKKLNTLKGDSEAAELVKKLDEDFRLYLLRELRIHTLKYSSREILKEIRRCHRILFEQHQGELRRLLFEFEKAKRDSSLVKAKDCEELLFLSRQLADHIFSTKRQQSPGAK